MILWRILLMMWLYQLCRLLFLAFNYSHFPSLTFHELPSILFGSLRFDIASILYLNVVYIALFIVPFNFRFNKTYQSVAKVVFILANSIGIIANLADCGYYRYTLRRTNASFFLEFKNDTNLLLDSWKFAFSYWYIVVLAVVLVWFLIRSYDWIKTPQKENYRLKQILFQIAVLPVLVILWLGLVRGSFNPSDRPMNISMAGRYVLQNEEISIVLNTPFSILTTLGNIKIPEVNYFPSIQEAEKYYNPVHAYTGNAPLKKNVVIIIVESLSKEFVGALNQKDPEHVSYTPFLDSLIGRSLRFEYAYSNGKRSIQALPAITASIPSHTEDYVLTPYASNQTNTLATVLKKHGYATSFFHGAQERSMFFTAFAKLAGFDKSFTREDYNNDKDYDGTWGIYDEEFMQYWAKHLNASSQPFCSVLFTLSSHYPCKIPDRYTGKFNTGAPMQCAIQYTDYAIGKYFETVSQMPWYKNTVFVITADHSSYPNHSFYNNTNGEFSIPIFFFTPDSSLTGDRFDIIQQTDIFPTLIDYLGIHDSIVTFGNSVLHNTGDELVVNWVSGLYQAFCGDYLLQFDGNKRIAFYQFKEDPQLQHNVLGKFPEEEERILLKLKAYIQQYAYRVRENKMVP